MTEPVGGHTIDRGPLIYLCVPFLTSPHLGSQGVIVPTSSLISIQGPPDLGPDHCSLLFSSALLPKACALTKSKTENYHKDAVEHFQVFTRTVSPAQMELPHPFTLYNNFLSRKLLSVPHKSACILYLSVQKEA